MSDGGKYLGLDAENKRGPSDTDDNNDIPPLQSQNLTRSHDEPCFSKKSVILFFRYAQVYFVTIATILGTGILGLPVTLSKSGFNPFLLAATISFLSQVLMIYLFTELLQKAKAVLDMSQHLVTDDNENVESIPLKQARDMQSSDSEIDAPSPLVTKQHLMHDESSPSLYTLARLFLPVVPKHLFNLIVSLQFIGLLITYALAGSEAYASLLNLKSYTEVIPVFTWLLAFFIVFVYKLVTPVVSVLTLAKGSILIVTVMVTFYVGASIHLSNTSNFKYLGEPFLLTTVALGGVINTMPMVFTHIKPVANQVKWFRMCCILGLTTCYILNIAWCWSVLGVVPQTQLSCERSNLVTLSTPAAQQEQTCPSLSRSKDRGEISTIPLTEIIGMRHPQFGWVKYLVEVFIMVSITVSFLTIGGAMHHTNLGWIGDVWVSLSSWYQGRPKVMAGAGHDSEGRPPAPGGGVRGFLATHGQALLSYVLGLAMFLIVYLVASRNPQGFEVILEKAVSLLINIESGVLFYFMIHYAREKPYRDIEIPCATAPWLRSSHYILLVFFTFAVFYDLFQITYRAVVGNEFPA